MPEGGWTEEYKTRKLVLRVIPAGTYIMGSPEGEIGRFAREVEHKVTLTRPFYAGVFEVTQRQYELVMDCSETARDTRPFEYTGYTRPAEQVAYDDIRGDNTGLSWPANNAVDEGSFMGILRAKTGFDFDLPTEAQWEYACRAETTTSWNNGTYITNENEDPELNKLGRYASNISDGKGGYDDKHTEVGSYLPNAWGLYDMHGNVHEWCLDISGDYTGAETDPAGASTNYSRVVRGGSYSSNASLCRSAFRYFRSTHEYVDVGFRVFLVK